MSVEEKFEFQERVSLDDIRDAIPEVRGSIRENADLSANSWFKVGGKAEILFKPEDEDDLVDFLKGYPEHLPYTVLGVSSNLIIRDGGVPGVVIKLGRSFAQIEVDREHNRIRAGGSALDINVAKFAQQASLTGLEFFSGIPGTIGGALRMNAGAYGRETKDVLVCCTAIGCCGAKFTFKVDEMGMSYRHSDVDENMIFTSAIFQGKEGDALEIQARMDEIKAKRDESQPIREKTGGSTFANPTPQELAAAGLPADTKTWQLVDRAGCRGLMVGGAQMSEQHCNFMINTGDATAADLENLGEEIRRRVLDNSGVKLRWEIRRIGLPSQAEWV